jgi:hypothetical protein
MEIEGIFSQQAHMLRHEISASEEHLVRKTQKDESQPAPPPRPDQEKNNDGETKGVVCLLQEEHFKGVADIRLRINFFNEFNAIKSEELIDGLNEIKASHESHVLKNNGKAYNKFLTILNNMPTFETPANDSSNDERLDTVA